MSTQTNFPEVSPFFSCRTEGSSSSDSAFQQAEHEEEYANINKVEKKDEKVAWKQGLRRGLHVIVVLVRVKVTGEVRALGFDAPRKLHLVDGKRKNNKNNGE